MTDRIHCSGLNDDNLQKDDGLDRIAYLITQLLEELRRTAPDASVQVDVRFESGRSDISTTTHKSNSASSSYTNSQENAEFTGRKANAETAVSVSKSDSHASARAGRTNYSSASTSSECETLRNVFSWDATKNYDIFEVERAGMEPDLVTLGGLEFTESSASPACSRAPSTESVLRSTTVLDSARGVE